MDKDNESSKKDVNEEENTRPDEEKGFGSEIDQDHENKHVIVGAMASTTFNDKIQSSTIASNHDSNDHSHHNYHVKEEEEEGDEIKRDHEPDCKNHHDPNNNYAANSSTVASISASFNNDDHFHGYFKDDVRDYSNSNTNQENHYQNTLPIVIQSRNLGQPRLETISPSSSVMANNETDEVIYDHIVDTLHNESLEIHHDEAKDSSLDDFIINENQHHILSSPESSLVPTTHPPPPPPPSEQTAREQLIERERQGRLERERARLKQQLALSRERDEEDEAYAAIDRVRERIASIDNNSLDVMDLTDVEEGEDDLSDVDEDLHHSYHGQLNATMSSNQNLEPGHNNDGFDENQGAFMGHGVSVGDASTSISNAIGDITSNNEDAIMNDQVNFGAIRGNGMTNVAQVSSAAPSPLGFTMERFLQDRAIAQPPNGDVMTAGTPLSNRDVESNSSNDPSDSHVEVRDHSSDNDSNTNHQLVDLVSEASSTSEIANVSIVAEPLNSLTSYPIVEEESNSVRRNMGTSSARNDRDYTFNDSATRLERLTEAEILELAEIDYASVGNMPPRSERDEQNLPSIHDLSGLGRMSNISDPTYATILESISMASADASQSEANSTIIRPVDESISSPAVNGSNNDPKASPENSSPLVSEVPSKPFEHISLSMTNSGEGTNIQSSLSNPAKLDSSGNLKADFKTQDDELKPPALYPENVSNHSFRVNLEDGAVEIINENNKPNDTYNLPNRVIRPGIMNNSSNPKRLPIHRRAQTTPIIPSFVDDFDFNKYESPEQNDLCKGIPELIDGSRTQTSPQLSYGDGYGSTLLHSNNLVDHQYSAAEHEEDEELRTLLTKQRRRRESVDEIVESVFSSVRSMSTDDIEADINDCDKYLRSSILQRAFPERFSALIVTLIIEIPVVLMISGGSSRLCALIGRSKYQLLMAFLPLSSAISGNCGLQASTLATRAISHLHVTKKNYWSWMLTEISVAGALGASVGVVVGGVAYQASGFDFGFAFTIFMANFISVLTAGLTGTLAPLIFTFIFHRDSGKWGGPIETAIQDIVGSYVMVILSYKILLWIGNGEVDHSDTCGKKHG